MHAAQAARLRPHRHHDQERHRRARAGPARTPSPSRSPSATPPTATTPIAPPRTPGATASTPRTAEIVDGMQLLARTEGLFAETAGGVTVAATRKLIESGRIRRDEPTRHLHHRQRASRRPTSSTTDCPSRHHPTLARGLRPRAGRDQDQGRRRMAVLVRVPTPLRSLTKGAAEVQGAGDTVDDVIEDLERQFPGMRDRLVDETRRAAALHQHLRQRGGHPLPRGRQDHAEDRRLRFHRARDRGGPMDGSIAVRDLEARAGLHRVRHPRDDAGEQPARRHQPRPGHAELPPAARAGRGRPSRARRRLPSVRDHLGHAAAAARHRARSTGASTAWRSIPSVTSPSAAAPPRPCSPPSSPCSTPATRSSSSSRSTRTTAPAASSPGRCPSGCRWSRRTSASIPTGSRGRSRRAREPSSSTARTTPPARCSRGPSSSRSRTSASSTTSSPSPTRSTSTSSTTARGTRRSRRCPGMAERTITISGISKSYSVTGWRVGYAIAQPGAVAWASAARTTSSRWARRIPCRRPRSPPSSSPTPTTPTSEERIRPAAICSSPRWRRPASWRGSRGAPITSSPTPPTS